MTESGGNRRPERRVARRGDNGAIDDQKAKGATRVMERMPKPPELMGKEKVLRASSFSESLIFATLAAAPMASLSKTAVAAESLPGYTVRAR